MRILFYTPLNTRCRDIESQAAAFVRQGHSIFLLTQSTEGPLHANFRKYDYTVAFQSNQAGPLAIRIIQRVLGLVHFCWKHKTDIVYAHLEPANFIAVMAQYLIPARVIICRHHVDEARLYGFEKTISYQLTYRLARTIIVVSARAKQFMVDQEGIFPEKIHPINLAYDFGLYELPKPDAVAARRDLHPQALKLLDVCRLTEYKRPFELITLARQLVAQDIPFHLTILGVGELGPALREIVRQSALEEYIDLPGYVDNVLEYMAASDLLVHPSILESSCISVKEAGLVGLPVIVCKGVGDFDETLSDGVDSFLLERHAFAAQAAAVITRLHSDVELRRAMGQRLRETILTRFSIDKVASMYETFHRNQ